MTSRSPRSGSSTENRRAGKRAELRKAGKVNAGELQQTVVGIYERSDGLVYVDVVEDAGVESLQATLEDNVSIETTVSSDGCAGYRDVEGTFAEHETISHREGEYVRGRVTINGIEMK